MSQKNIISFDLDGTIVNSEFADNVWLKGLPKYYAKEKRISYQKSKSFLMNAYDQVSSDNRKWYDLSYWISEYNIPITPKELLNEYQQTIQVYEDVYEVIKSLSNDYTLIISSGAMKEFIDIELKKTGLEKYFTKTFSSTTDTYTVKKDPSFYLMIAKQMKTNPSNIIHVGDNEQYDYISPMKAGLTAFYLNRTSFNHSDHMVSSLFEFEHKIRKLI